jgi:hypothetical protein
MNILSLPIGNWLFTSPDLPDECFGLELDGRRTPTLSFWRRGRSGCGEAASPAVSVPLTEKSRGTYVALTGHRPTHKGPQSVEVLVREVIDAETALGAVRIGNHSYYEVVLARRDVSEPGGATT